MSEETIERGWTDMGEARKPGDFVVQPYMRVHPEMGDAYCSRNCGWKLWEHGVIVEGNGLWSGTTVCPKRRTWRDVGDLLRALDHACESVKGSAVTAMIDGGYEFEIADHGYHASLTLRET